MLTVGLDAMPGSIVEVMPAVLDHFGVAPPPYARALARREVVPGARGLPPQARDPDARVLEAIAAGAARAVRPGRAGRRAYDDRALPIGHGQTISQPFMVATICAALELGATSACSTSAPARATRRPCWRSSRPRSSRSSACPSSPSGPVATLAGAGYERVEVRVGDGTLGVPERAPFDGIAVAAAAPSVPETLYEQLAPAGRVVVPVGSLRDQRLEIVSGG